MTIITTHSDKKVENKIIKPQQQHVNGFYSMNAIVKAPKTGCSKCGH
jgi:hypothetical protein